MAAGRLRRLVLRQVLVPGPVAASGTHARRLSLSQSSREPRRRAPRLGEPERSAADPPQRTLDRGRPRDGSRECARLGRRVYGTQPLADLIVRETSPGPNVVSDVDLDAFTRCSAEVGHHPVGTCAMGASPQAVVDSQLRLRGREGLRVVDASVMPSVPRRTTRRWQRNKVYSIASSSPIMRSMRDNPIDQNFGSFELSPKGASNSP